MFLTLARRTGGWRVARYVPRHTLQTQTTAVMVLNEATHGDLRRRGSFRPRMPPTLDLRSGWHGARTKLKPRDTKNFVDAEPALFAQFASVVCNARVLPRKELFETWEAASRIDSAFPNASRVADLAAGHGLLGWCLLLLAMHRGVPRSVVCVDARMPASADALRSVITQTWPEAAKRLHYVESKLHHIEASENVLITSVHACGPLTDAVIERAVSGGAPVAVMPCCHSLRKQQLPPEPGITEEVLATRAKELGMSHAIDSARVKALQASGYHVTEEFCDPDVTPYNRLILAKPSSPSMTPTANTANPLLGKWPTAILSRTEEINQESTPPVPLADVDAIAAISGRRPYVRSIGVSLWLPEGSALNEAKLAVLARYAMSAPWTPKDSEKELAKPHAADADASNATALLAHEKSQPWDVRRAVEAARQERGPLSSGRGSDGKEHDSNDALDVSVSLQDVYFDSSARRACTFIVEFSCATRELRRGEVNMWQTRIRQALEWWGSEGGGGFELR